MARFTNQQLEAINRKGKFTILSAAAGSGKTTVLVERVIRLITEQGADISKMLIVTFSRASRADFRRKISDALDKKIKEYADSEKAAAKNGTNPKVFTDRKIHLQNQKNRLKTADISTINAFAMKLALQNFETLGIPSDSGVCDDATAKHLHSKAIDGAMEYGYGLRDFNDLVACFGKSSSDKEIRRFLSDMDNFFKGQPNPEKRAEKMKNAYAVTDCIKDTPYYRIMSNSIKRKADYLKFLSDRMLRLYEESAVTGYDNGLESIARFSDLAVKYAAEEDFSSLKTHIEGVGRALKLGTAKTKDCGEYDIKLKDGIRELYGDNFKTAEEQILKDISYLDEDKFKRDNAATKKYIDVLFDVYFKYQQLLTREKLKNKSFEFNDYEHFAARLLADEDGRPTPLCLKLREHYDYIMEDEYQDTSAVQDAIFCMLAKDNLSNLYVVGDIKQSIYRFRNATPQIFLDKRRLGEKEPEKYNTMYLSKNFRSDYGILRDVNYIFSKLMNKNCGGIEYNENEMLYYRDDGYVPSDADICTEIVLCEDCEAEFVAGKIAKMIADGVQIDEGGSKRAVNAGDFCILLRSFAKAADYYEALSKINIESVVRDDESPLTKPEVESVINLLRVIANPTREIYLTATMFGEMFGFTLDELIDIRVQNKKQNFYRLLKRSGTEKSKAFLQTLKEFHDSRSILSPDKLIDHICRKTGYYKAIAFSENGSEKRENIRRFIAFAKSWAKTHNRDLPAFLRRIDINIENGAKSESKTVFDKDKVTIMTMHSSKGLEFPVVFLSNLGKKFNKKDESKNILMHPDYGMGIYAKKSFGRNVSTLQIRAIKKAMSQDTADDEIRLLYVAATRAKNYLFLTSNRRTKAKSGMSKYEKIMLECGDGIPEYFTAQNNSRLNWILGAAANAESVKNDFSLKRTDGADKCRIALSLFDGWDAVAQSGDKETDYEWDDGTTAAVMSNLSYVYPNELKTKLPIKVSVSLISKSADTVLQKPDFTDSQIISRADRGTAVHNFLAHCDILRTRENYEAECERLSQSGLVNTAIISKKAVMNFVNSPIADMILKAEKIEKERNFRIPISARLAMGDDAYRGEEVLLQGIMDCVLIDKDGVTVIDYKTDNVKSTAVLKERYSMQLELYRLGAKALYGAENVKCIIYSLTLDEYIYV
ncbi:MAG: UvrD-helicase domain-containing protein [Oscillospiraceae bacterium]|nr:UvrD-helicase domain-containing protein [Oscillospiraceae bacterium]